MAEGATAAPAGAAPAAGAQQPAGTNAHPAGKPGETKAQTIARLKADLGDGEQEYEQSHLVELARRGRQTSRIMSKAEQRAQEALKKEQEADAKLAKLRSKDLKERRAALKELGFDEVEFAKSVAQEVMETEALTPEQRRIRELEQQLQAEDAAKAKAKDEETKKASDADMERHKEEFSNLFLDVMERAGLPKESATVAYYRLASMYQAADAAGATLDPDVAAEHLKGAMRSEHTALFRKKDGSLDLDAFEASLSPEDWKAINKRAVEKYRAGRGGVPKPLPTPTPQQDTPPAQTNGTKRPVGNAWFKSLDKQYQR